MKFRFHNQTGAVSSATGYAGQDGLLYAPIGTVNPAPPQADMDAPPNQFPSVVDPRYGSAELEYNGQPMGPFVIGPSAANLERMKVHLYPHPTMPGQVAVTLTVWDKDKKYEQVFGAP